MSVVSITRLLTTKPEQPKDNIRKNAYTRTQSEWPWRKTQNTPRENQDNSERADSAWIGGLVVVIRPAGNGSGLFLSMSGARTGYNKHC